MKKYLLIFCALFSGLSACKKTTDFDAAAQEVKDDALLQTYLSSHNITAVQDPSGLYYQVLTKGSGAYPTASSSISVSYKGTLLDGTIFDSSTAFTTALTAVIRGWTIGLQHLQPGGRIMLYVPSDLGYGNNVNGAIPASSCLIFDITLVSIN